MPDTPSPVPRPEVVACPELAKLPRWKRLAALAEPHFGWSQGDDEAAQRVRRAAYSLNVSPADTIAVSVRDLRALCAIAEQSQFRYALAEEYRIERDKARRAHAAPPGAEP